MDSAESVKGSLMDGKLKYLLEEYSGEFLAGNYTASCAMFW